MLFGIGGTVFYNSLTSIINDSITERIYEMKDRVDYYVKKTGRIPAQSPIELYRVVFSETDKPVKQELKDTVMADEDEESQPFRALIFPVTAGGINYSASIIRPLVESDDLIESIAWSLCILAIILLVVLFLLNWWLSKTMWRPFNSTLEKLKKFDLNKKEAMNFEPVNTAEFRHLNEAIGKMTEKILNDYQNLKEFTENASHELQTPLAIIRSKLELMVQAENLSAEQMKQVQDIYESVNRLSKLNQSLLLLAKIENRQFHEMQMLDISSLVEIKLGQLEELIDLKGLKVEKRLNDPCAVNMNPHLADILLSNILSNSIRHNTSGGKIIVEVKNKVFYVSNTGTPLEIPDEKLFDRFQKGTSSSESVGLGLSIVKQICDTYNFKVKYSYSEGMHTISVSF